MNLSNMPSNIKCTLDISTGSYRVDYVVIHKTIPITFVYKKFQKQETVYTVAKIQDLLKEVYN